MKGTIHKNGGARKGNEERGLTRAFFLSCAPITARVLLRTRQCFRNMPQVCVIHFRPQRGWLVRGRDAAWRWRAAHSIAWDKRPIEERLDSWCKRYSPLELTSPFFHPVATQVRTAFCQRRKDTAIPLYGRGTQARPSTTLCQEEGEYRSGFQSPGTGNGPVIPTFQATRPLFGWSTIPPCLPTTPLHLERILVPTLDKPIPLSG